MYVIYIYIYSGGQVLVCRNEKSGTSRFETHNMALRGMNIDNISQWGAMGREIVYMEVGLGNIAPHNWRIRL